MKPHSLLSGKKKKKKNIINLWSFEFAQRAVKMKYFDRNSIDPDQTAPK